jgi:hypothetical protein
VVRWQGGKGGRKVERMYILFAALNNDDKRGHPFHISFGHQFLPQPSGSKSSSTLVGKMPH